MGRMMLTVGMVATDAAISGMTWASEADPVWLGLTALTSALGLCVAARSIADGLFTDSEATV